MSATFFGDWDLFQRWKQSILVGKYIGDLMADMAKLGDEIKNTVIGHIDKQDLPWPGLSDATIKKKGHDQIYVETGEYMRSITSSAVRTPTGASLVVTVKGVHSGSGLQMADLGRILEFGSSTTPARPLWGPTLQELINDPNFQEVVNLSRMFKFR